MTEAATTPMRQPHAEDGAPVGIEVLTFDLQGEVFALEATAVREILDMIPATPVPGADHFVESVINFRGRVIPLADLRLAFGMDRSKESPEARIIVIEIPITDEATLVGLRTDGVREVTTLSDACREPPPSVGMRWRPDYIRALFREDEEFIVLPDLDAIFAADLSGTAGRLRPVN